MVLTGFWLDIIMLAIFLVMVVLGIHTGFVKKIYDLLSLVVVFFITLYLYKPFASFLMFMTTKDAYEMVSIVVQLTTSLFYQCLAFLILFILLMIVRKLIGIIIRPLIDKVIGFFKLIKGIDRLLAIVLYGFIAILINASLIFALPWFKQDSAIVDDSKLAPYILEIAPKAFSEGVEFLNQLDLAKQYEDSSQLDEQSFKTFIDLMIQGSKLGLIDQEMIDQFILSNENTISHLGMIDINLEDYLQLQTMIENSTLPQETKNSILEIFNVKEE